MMYNLEIIYKNSQPSEIWGPFTTLEEARNIAAKAETYPRVVDVILIPVIN